MNGLERVTRALQIQEPDRVPFFEPPSWKIMGEVLPGGSYVDAIEHFDLDAVMIDDRANERYLCEQIDDVLFRNQWGTVVQMAAEALPHPVDGPISSENDLDEWTPPDPDAPWRFEVLEAVVKRYKGEKAIIASFADPFNVANEMRGASDHYMDFVRNPRLVDRLAGVITDYYLRYLRNCIEAGADIIFITGDYATTKWPMLSPDHFAKHVIPYLKTLVDASIEGGALTMKHTDGNIMPILDQIVDTGIHGLHPIDEEGLRRPTVPDRQRGLRPCLDLGKRRGGAARCEEVHPAGGSRRRLHLHVEQLDPLRSHGREVRGDGRCDSGVRAVPHSCLTRNPHQRFERASARASFTPVHGNSTS
jgi:hypothetical protein